MSQDAFKIAGWIERPPLVREGKTYEWHNQWFLEADKKTSQPIGTHVGKDYNKNTYECVLGKFAGAFCVISTQKTEELAVNDCVTFMKSNTNRAELSQKIDTCYYEQFPVK